MSDETGLPWSQLITGEWYYCHLPHYPKNIDLGRFWGADNPPTMYLDGTFGMTEGHLVVLSRVPRYRELERIIERLNAEKETQP